MDANLSAGTTLDRPIRDGTGTLFAYHLYLRF